MRHRSFQSGHVFDQWCSVLQLPGANAGKPDVKGLAEKAAKKSPLGFMNVGELAFDLPGSGVSKDDLPNSVKPGDAAGLPKGPTAKPPSAPSLPKVQTAALCCSLYASSQHLWLAALGSPQHLFCGLSQLEACGVSCAYSAASARSLCTCRLKRLSVIDC